jgi:hypothetical protein
MVNGWEQRKTLIFLGCRRSLPNGIAETIPIQRKAFLQTPPAGRRSRPMARPQNHPGSNSMVIEDV